MRRVVLAVLLAVSVGCSSEKGGSVISPEIPSFSGGGSVSLLSLVQGTWTGSETATVGLSGSLSVNFTQPPTVDANVAGSVEVVLSTGTFHGTFSGTVNNIAIVATDGPAGTCNYTANGVLNEAGTQITGTYTGSGEGPNCINKAGTFVLNGQSVVDACPNLDGYQAQVPEGYHKADGICVVNPPPCSQVNPPSFEKGPIHENNGTHSDHDSSTITADVTFHNAGVWVAKLVRVQGSQVKDTETVTLLCGESQTVHLSYTDNDSGQHTWRVDVYLNGVLQP